MAVAAIIGNDADIVHQHGIDNLIQSSEPPIDINAPRFKKMKSIKNKISESLKSIVFNN